MKIDWLRLENFKNLQDFEVDFSLNTERQVIIGRNGVGKSNILEAIAWIFRDLDLAEESDFEYSIKYKCRSHYVKIVSKGESSKKAYRKSSRKDNVQRYRRKYWIIDDAGVIEGKSPEEIESLFVELKEGEFNQRNRPIKNSEGETCFTEKRLLPDYVFGYYSGISARFNQAFEDHERGYYDAQRVGDEGALRTMFLAKPHHSQFSLLSFFAKKDAEAEKFLKDEFGIEHLSSVLFKLQEPYWSTSTKKNALKAQKEDRRFWGAKGNVDPFLDKLFAEALLPMGGSERKELSFKQTKIVETRYCFLPSEQSVLALADGLDAKVFFSRLESTIFSDLLSLDGEGLKIRVKLAGVDTPITFKEMSEGEQQLLTIIGLMRFTQQNESLFLLDEPDTHLNPAWCLDLLKNLREYGVDPKNSQILITTHSPLTFAGLDKHEVVIVDKNSDGQIYSYHPTTAPKGMGFQAILTSDFFKLRSTLDRDTLKLLDEKRELGLKEDKTDEDRQRLDQLNTILGKLDFSHAARDPLYLEYIRAMTEAQKQFPAIANATPDHVSWQVRKRISFDIARRLSRKKEGV
ncbi:AAA family ATPase [Alkalimonas amylolytica]|uniref:AAA domain-containing protein, putative AbiEii toxin, Type IV TA system n=1 Tax=Alkalimonas amylolytica TaxID=152573 RepID=A0A1H3YFT5_ALKAM|nr:AAA family ATPase [Alkalimonas amylolytica]SEA10460.1 AAA domain-containing protein, putative AbiEii toxin, Type IV TA system [Alkalimonas amylolytica]